MIHQVNILIHVIAGTLALLVGTYVLIAPKSGSTHIRWGRYYLYLLSVVVITGFLGWLFFRSNPLLFLLTLIAGYSGFAGWRAVRLRKKRSRPIDFWVAVATFTLSAVFLASLHLMKAQWNPSVVYATFGSLGFVTIYDIAKHLLWHAALKEWWVYEHIYKMISTFSALLSAFAVNVLPAYQPLSQLLPTILCLLLVVMMIWRQIPKQRKRKVKPDNIPQTSVDVFS